MEIWTTEIEADNLAKLFTGVNRSEFARQHGMNHNVIYQQLKGIRPINMPSAVLYAKYFNVPLDKISPRLAIDAKKIKEVKNMSNVSPELDSDTLEMMAIFGKLDKRGKKKALLALYDLVDAIAKTNAENK